MTDPAAVARGWSAADVHPDELVDDAWIAANTAPGKAPSKLAHLGRRAARAVRPRLQSGPLSRDQMRRIAARTGYPYVEAWSAHNEGSMYGVWGALIHHTGTAWSAAGDYPTLRIVRDGRADLNNSLCMFGLGRSGTVYLVSEKLSWHAGAGNVNGLTDGNGYLAGIEAESDGVNWTAEERDAYPRLVASILIEIGQTDPRPNYGDRYTTRHASFALPVGRKVDASGLDMDLFWRQVYGYLADPATIGRGGVPTPTPTPTPPAGAPPRLTWNLPAGHYYGNIAGPAQCHGGINPSEKAFVANIWQWLIYHGCVPGHAPGDWRYVDASVARWGADMDAQMATWHARFYPQKFPSQCWSDDYARLARP